MSKWTTNPADLRHFANIVQQIHQGMTSGNVTVVMHDKSEIVGCMKGINVQSNGKHGPAVRQSGSVNVDTAAGRVEIDFLDIETVILPPNPTVA